MARFEGMKSDTGCETDEVVVVSCGVLAISTTLQVFFVKVAPFFGLQCRRFFFLHFQLELPSRERSHIPPNGKAGKHSKVPRDGIC